MKLLAAVLSALLPILAIANDNTFIVLFKDGSWASAKEKNPALKNSKNAEVYKNSLIKNHDFILSSLSKEGKKISKLYSYVTAYNGFSAVLSENQVKILKGNKDVEHVFEDIKHFPTTITTPKFLGLQGGSSPVWSNTTGANVVIGVVDSGITPWSPSFNGTGYAPLSSPGTIRICQAALSGPLFRCNNKIIGARYFYAGYQAGSRSLVVNSKDYLSAIDISGHGTHTASTAAGGQVFTSNGRVSGMAYNARIIAYKVCWGEGECWASDIIAAFDTGVGDKVDLFTVSLGPSDPIMYYRDVEALAILQGAIKNNIPVVYAAGNSGYVSTVTNGAPWLLTVAASTHDRLPLSSSYRFIKLGSGVTQQGLSSPTWNDLSDKPYPLILSSVAGPSSLLADFCITGSLTPSLVQGKIVICKNGKNSRGEKSMTVALAGGVGMILYNPVANNMYSEYHAVPTLHVDVTAGNMIISYVIATSNASGSAILTPQIAPTIAYFSSTGPNAASRFVLKPDITAPGVQILAAVPDSQGSYGFLSGTSMATPHVAGVVALIKALRPTWTPGRIYSAIITSGTTLDNNNGCIKDSNGYCATPWHMGGGHLNPKGALNPGLVYDMPWSAYNSFMCTASGGWTVRTPSCPKKLLEVNFNFPYLSIPSLPVGQRVITTRSLTLVGTPGKYTAVVKSPAGATVVVSPLSLTFTRVEQVLSYTITVTATQSSRTAITRTSFDPAFRFTYGSVTWVNGAFSVKANVAVFVP